MEDNSTPEEIEQASSQGWTQKSDFKGDQERWRTAAEFLAVGKTIQAVQSERNDALLGEIKTLKSDFQVFQDQQFKVISEAAKNGYNKAVTEIKKKQREAVEDGDVEKFDSLEKEKKNLDKPEPKQAAPKIDPIFTEWHKGNDWYKPGGGSDLSLAADTYGMALIKREPDLRGMKYYQAVEKHIKTVFPDEFKTVRPSIDDSGNNGSGGNGKKSFNDLPSEAKKACNMQVAKLGISKDDYVKEYFREYGE